MSSSGKRKAGMSEQEVKVCERILLELFCHPSSVPFQEPVNKAVSVDATSYKCRIEENQRINFHGSFFFSNKKK